MVRRPIRSTKTPVPGVKEASCASSIGPPGYPRGVGEDRHTGLQGAHTAIPLLREGQSQEVTTEARTRHTTVPDQWFTAEEVRSDPPRTDTGPVQRRGVSRHRVNAATDTKRQIGRGLDEGVTSSYRVLVLGVLTALGPLSGSGSYTPTSGSCPPAQPLHGWLASHPESGREARRAEGPNSPERGRWSSDPGSSPIHGTRSETEGRPAVGDFSAAAGQRGWWPDAVQRLTATTATVDARKAGMSS